MKYGIYVGTTPETISATTEAILAILNTRADQKTLREALRCFAKGVSINNTSIVNCSINSCPENENSSNS